MRSAKQGWFRARGVLDRVGPEHQIETYVSGPTKMQLAVMVAVVADGVPLGGNAARQLRPPLYVPAEKKKSAVHAVRRESVENSWRGHRIRSVIERERDVLLSGWQPPERASKDGTVSVVGSVCADGDRRRASRNHGRDHRGTGALHRNGNASGSEDFVVDVQNRCGHATPIVFQRALPSRLAKTRAE